MPAPGSDHIMQAISYEVFMTAMKKRLASGLLFLGALGLECFHAVAGGDAGLAAIDRMSELNGVALACRFDDQMRRIKQALIGNLPKQRELGARFEEGTNAAFMRFVQAGEPCPSPARFESEVNLAVEQLRQAYAQAD